MSHNITELVDILISEKMSVIIAELSDLDSTNGEPFGELMSNLKTYHDIRNEWRELISL